MSKSIVIKEVDTNKTLSNVDKLKTNKSGGGSVYWVPEDEVQLGTKNITQNGTYNANSDNKYGYSQVTVNVKGGNGSADSHGKPTGGGIKPGGAGSAVVGTDPETGEDVVVGVDESGNIVQTPIPYGIKIVTPPTKTDYVYQETMDYSGIGVKLTNKNGDTYTDVDHPSGWYVNPADLIFPVDKAPAGRHSYGNWSADPSWVCSTANAYLCTVGPRQYHKINNGPAVVAFINPSTPSGWRGPYLISDNPESIQTDQFQSSRTFSWEGNTFYYNSGGHLRPMDWDGYDSGALHVIEGNLSAEEALNAIMNAADVHASGGSDNVTIPVQWVNPYTGETHQDTFQITSTPADGDAHTSASSNGTEGSGGGGTF